MRREFFGLRQFSPREYARAAKSGFGRRGLGFRATH